MIKYLIILLLFGLTIRQESIEDLIYKKPKSIIFKRGQNLIVKYTNGELNVVFNTGRIERKKTDRPLL